MKTELMIPVIAFVLLMLLLFFFAIAIAVRYRKRKRENESLKARFEQERLRIQVEMQDETLAHISRELHDNFGHIASLIKIHLNTINDTDTATLAKVDQVKELTRQLISDIKLLSVSLSNDQNVKKGIVPAIEIEVERLKRTGLFSVQFNVEQVIPPLDDNTAMILIRMIQELINNTIKHSRAQQISIQLEYLNDDLIIRLIDDGIGFNNNSEKETTGAGLLNLQYRASLIGAGLTIDSKKGIGTNTTIILPIKPTS
jgi:two-component system, NarL family, sensor kinase